MIVDEELKIIKNEINTMKKMRAAEKKIHGQQRIKSVIIMKNPSMSIQ